MIDKYQILEREDLSPDMQMIYDLVGIDIVKKLLENYSGLSFYVPKITRFDTMIMRYIKLNKEKTLKQVAMELSVTEQYLKNLVKKYREMKN
tara:strand:- start:11 stop:286 length:276 start_codon:yes stop_codon:yes gene_type:complete